MKIDFICLASGSNGNCYYLAADGVGLLIDAGIGPRTIRKRLKDVGLCLETVRAIFLTHDHGDHIRGVGGLADKWNLPVYATPLAHIGISHSHSLRQPLSRLAVRYIEKQQPVSVGPFSVVAFEIPHDGTDNVGYCIEVDGRTFTFMTDLGHTTPTAAYYARRAHYLIIEANYDEAMLSSGPYPQDLKDRIAGPRGHLSNAAAASFLAENASSRLQHVWLCHLSRDNNRPEVAEQTVADQLAAHGITIGQDLQLTALHRGVPSPLYVF